MANKKQEEMMQETVQKEVQETDQQTETNQDETGKQETAGEKRVRIHLFKDNDRYSDDVSVAVNGKLYVIQRGVDVDVPVSVKEVLDNSQAQDRIAEKRMEEFQKQYEKVGKNL